MIKIKQIFKISTGVILGLIILDFASTALIANNLYYWSIKTPTSNIYLLGSIHIANQDFYPLDKNIEDGFTSSDNLVLECLTDNVVYSDIFKVVSYNDTTVLKDHLKSDVYDMLAKYCADNNINIDSYSKIKPWYTSILLMQLKLAKAGYKSIYGIDNYFYSKARAINKNILELETPKEQLDYFTYFDNFSDEYIKYSFQNLDSSEADAKKLIEAYLKGDDETLLSLINFNDDRFKEISEINSKIIDERNKKMFDKIQTYLEVGGNYFIIVGTAHLIGEKSIINMLKEKEFNIKRYSK